MRSGITKHPASFPPPALSGHRPTRRICSISWASEACPPTSRSRNFNIEARTARNSPASFTAKSYGSKSTRWVRCRLRGPLKTGMERPKPDEFQDSGLRALGSSIQNLLPSPSPDSSPTRPPRRSTPFLTMARPMPVPGYVSTPCSRSKTLKIRS